LDVGALLSHHTMVAHRRVSVIVSLLIGGTVPVKKRQNSKKTASLYSSRNLILIYKMFHVRDFLTKTYTALLQNSSVCICLCVTCGVSCLESSQWPGWVASHPDEHLVTCRPQLTWSGVATRPQ